jgi:hypothetical protein
MTIFAVQRQLTGISMEDLGAAQKAAIEKSNEFTEKGVPVTYIRSNFYPKNGKCTCLFEAQDAVAVQRLNEEASLPFDSIEEVFDLNPK